MRAITNIERRAYLESSGARPFSTCNTVDGGFVNVLSADEAV